MDQETALPTDGNVEAGEQATTQATPATEVSEQPAEKVEAAAEGEETAEQKEAKKEKTPEQREIDRLRRRVDNLTRRKYQLEAQRGQEPAQRQEPPASNDEPVTLSRAELDRMVAERAEKLAPAIKDQQAEIEHRTKVVASLAKEWGKEEFDAKASDLDDAMGGLMDRSGRPKPATDAIFEADNPKGVIEYLTDPDNADEAERIASLSPIRAGRAIALIEAKLKAATPKPQASKAPKPLEPVKGQGSAEKDPSRMSDAEFREWRRKQINSRN